MDIPKNELFSVLQQFNPWWTGAPIVDLPSWQRFAARLIWQWATDADNKRALLLTGARQVGKTTLLRQTIRQLLGTGVAPGQVLYATLDHPLLKLAGLERTLQAWDELHPPAEGQVRYVFLDEIQYMPDWQTWLKHQVDFKRSLRIAATGSANPLRNGSAESGVGRWETIPLPTLSFGEFLKLRDIAVPPGIPAVRTLRDLFDWTEADFARARAAAQPLTGHFHDYLLRGGFPEPALTPELARCQRLLREDIVDKILKRDMTAFYGVRRVLEVERIFLYLCYHDGGILDIPTLCGQLEGVNRQTALNFLELFEAAHLITRLKPFGYGKEVLRGRDKVYLADAALPGAMMLLGQQLLTQPERLGAAVETAFFKHILTRYWRETPEFSYWVEPKSKQEVDVITRIGDRLVPFEVKYQDTAITPARLKGMRQFMESRKVPQGYVITQRWEDFGRFGVNSMDKTRAEQSIGEVVAIPAPLACFWMSEL
ncbi:MAG: ATP-binding protein [Inhella sp.]